MSTALPWYSAVSGTQLEQGDFLDNCLLPVIPQSYTADTAGEDSTPITGRRFNVIVLTQSCDLGKKQARNVMVCPIFEIEAYLKGAKIDPSKVKDFKTKIHKGQLVAYHLLEKSSVPDHERAHMVVDFGSAFGVPREYAESLCNGTRLRLQPPYRERLAQAFGLYFMRVGLPLELTPLP